MEQSLRGLRVEKSPSCSSGSPSRSTLSKTVTQDVGSWQAPPIHTGHNLPAAEVPADLRLPSQLGSLHSQAEASEAFG